MDERQTDIQTTYSVCATRTRVRREVIARELIELRSYTLRRRRGWDRDRTLRRLVQQGSGRRIGWGVDVSATNSITASCGVYGTPFLVLYLAGSCR